MSRLRLVLLALLALVPLRAGAQQVAPAVPPSPAAIEATPPPAAPIAVRQRDAAPLPPPPAAQPAPPPPAGNGTVVVPLESVPPENATSRFLFRDVTDRPARHVKTLPERKAAMEAFRQSLGARGPAK